MIKLQCLTKSKILGTEILIIEVIDNSWHWFKTN